MNRRNVWSISNLVTEKEKHTENTKSVAVKYLFFFTGRYGKKYLSELLYFL